MSDTNLIQHSGSRQASSLQRDPIVSSVTLNAAFLKEVKDLNDELDTTLKWVDDMCSRPWWMRRHANVFVELLNKLRDQLGMHFALEEAYGYFDDPAYVAPHLSDRIDALRKQHPVLFVELCACIEHAEALLEAGNVASLVVRIGGRVESFRSKLQRHEQDENALIMELYCEDIGVGD